MSRPIIEVRGISKTYRLGAIGSTSLKEEVGRLWSRVRGKERENNKGEFWALRDVSFDVQPGEVVGIIGRNGAGKSTLLKILSRITQQTAGEITLRGRVASLLEVGTGFHPDLTGRENVFLNGAILGMSKAEIARKFDEIVAFAEVEKFIDTPVKRYSSGMYVRLAFAVAAHLEPEILIVDEVLAVGDIQFQRKCIGKMDEVAKGGRTVLFVSHNMPAVQSLCGRAVWLHSGQVVAHGNTHQILSDYQRQSFSDVGEHKWNDIKTAPGIGSVRLRRVSIRAESGDTTAQLSVGTPFSLEIEYWNLELGAYLNLSLHLINEEGVTIFSTVPYDEPVWHGRPFPKGLFRSVCRVPGNLLNDGVYKVQVLVVKNQNTVIFNHENALTFQVHDVGRHGWHGKWVGAVRPMLSWTTELVEGEQTQVRGGADFDPEAIVDAR